MPPEPESSLALDTLLATKLAIPATRSELVGRPRLLDALNAGLSRKLTLISAPAGFGKTTLLSTWAGVHDSPVGWLTLDEADNDPARFLTYCVAAMRTCYSDVGESVLVRLQAQPPPALDSLMTALINDLFRLPGRLALVLDDYHAIHRQEIHDIVTLLLDRQPPQLHLLLTTRSDPPLPLPRLRGRGELSELRAADLRFTRGEAVAFLGRGMGVELSDAALATLEARIEGWAVGLQLAGLALKGQADAGAFIDDFRGSHRYVIDYLTDEVLQRQPDELRRFLRETSILDSLSPSLCDAVLAWQQSQETLAALEQANLFVAHLDDRRQWYRYHPLFQDALRYRLREQADADRVRELHRRAARWYRQNGFADDALSHWLEAGDHGEAADLVEAEGMAMLTRGQLSKLRAWLDALPAELVRARPWLSVQYGWVLNLMGQIDEMELRLQDAERRLPDDDAHNENRIRGSIAIIRAGGARKQRRTEAAIAHLQAALALLPETEVLLRSSAQFNLGSAYLDLGRPGPARETLLEAVRGAQAANSPITIVAGKSYLADAYVLQGELRRAARLYEEARGAEPDKLLPLAGYACSGLGQVLYEQNALAEAESQLNLALELGESLADRTIVRRALPTLARLRRLSGDPEGAEAFLDRALDLAQQYGDRSGIAYVEAFRARLDLEHAARSADRSALAAAGRWAEAYRNSAPATAYPEVFAQITLAWVEITRGDPEPALRRLAQVAEAAKADGRADCRLKALACLALARDAIGQAEAAQAALRQAVELAAREGYCRTFVDFGAAMYYLLSQMAARDPGLEYAGTLLAAFPAEVREAPSASLVERLTDRELEVLRLLAAGLPNREIADRLVVALGTVKQYNHIIFRKLDVRTREEAAQRARELNLL